MKKIMIFLFLFTIVGMNAQGTLQDTVIRKTILLEDNFSYVNAAAFQENWTIKSATAGAWMFNAGGGNLIINSYSGANSWMINKTGITVEKDKVYKITFSVLLKRFTDNTNNKLEITVGDAADSAGMTVIETLDGWNAAMETKSITYTAEESGVKYFGFHCNNPTRDEGEQIQLDNITILQETAVAFPIAYQEDWESYESKNSAMTAWTRTFSAQPSHSWTAGFQQKSFDATVALPAPYGEKQVYIEGSEHASDAWLISPDVALEQGVAYTIKFNVVMAGWKGKNQVLNVKIGQGKTTGNLTEALASYTANNSNWATKVVTFTPAASGNYNIGFQCETPANDGEYILIDNIRFVEDAEVIDAAIVAIEPADGTSQNFTHKEAVKVTIKNFGNVDISNFPVSYRVDNGTPKTGVFTGTIAPGATAGYTFADSADLWLNGEHTIAAMTMNVNDDISDNDEMSVTVTSTTTEYDVYVVNISAPNAANPMIYKTNEPVKINIRNNSSVAISNFPVTFQVSKVDGATQNAVTETVTETITPNATLAYTFKSDSADLSELGVYNMIAYAELDGDANGANDTTGLTNIRCWTVDLAMDAIVSPADGASELFSDTVEISIRIKNNGMHTYTGSIPVSYMVDDMAITKKDANITAVMYGGQLKPDSTYVYTFTGASRADLAEIGTHTITAWSRYTANPQEQNRSNDTVTITVTTTDDAAPISEKAESVKTTVIYPNPVSDKLFIKAEGLQRAEIYTIEGKLVKTVRNATEEISVETLKTGTYVLKLTANTGIESHQFIKN